MDKQRAWGVGYNLTALDTDAAAYYTMHVQGECPCAKWWNVEVIAQLPYLVCAPCIDT